MTRYLLACGVAFALGVAAERWRQDWSASGWAHDRRHDRITERVPR